MKRILLFISIFYSCITYSQTYIGPVIGYDYSRLENNEDQVFDLVFSEKGFSMGSPFIGFKLEQNLYKGLFLSYQFDYSSKEIKGSDNGHIPIRGITFKYLRNDLSINYLYNDFVYFGVGLNYNLLRYIHFIADENPQQYDTKSETGTNLMVGIKYHFFDLKIYYLTGLSSYKAKGYPTYFFKPISSYGVSLSYDFKVFNAPNFKKGSTCPKF